MNATARKHTEEMPSPTALNEALAPQQPHVRKRRTLNTEAEDNNSITPHSFANAPASAPVLINRAAMSRILRYASCIRVHSVMLGCAVDVQKSKLAFAISAAPEDAQFIQPRVDFVDGVGYVITFH